MKKIIIKLISIIILILSAFIIIFNTKDIFINIINLFTYLDSISNKIIIIGLLRVLLKLVLIIYSVIIMLIQIKLIRNEELSKIIKTILLLTPIFGIILQILNLSDYISNILLVSVLILTTIELIIVIMKKTIRRISFVFLILYILIIIVILLFSYKFCHNYELPTNKKGTSTNAVITKNINHQIWQMSTEAEFFYNSFQNKKEKNNYNLIPIPGLNYTDTVSKDNSLLIETCTTMTPQGLVVTDEYIYISAYCYTHEHNSVIYQIERKTNSLSKTIVLPDTSHVGGLAYDNKNKVLWIATKKYNTNKKDTTLSTVSCITQDVIDNYDFNISKSPIRYNETYQTAFTNTSFMTYHNGYLFTGLFSKNKNSITAKIKILEDGTEIDPEPISYSYIPNYVQSMAFIDNKLLLVISYSFNNSKILVYDYNDNEIDYVNKKPIKEISTYPMLEQIYPLNNDLYMIFESTAYAYRYTPGIKIDHIVNINKKILN